MPIVQKAINWDNDVWLKAVNAVADMNGWTETVPNPKYVEGNQEPATIPNPNYTEGGEEPETIPNPAYIQGNGEPETIPNPQGKVPFFNAWLKKKAINEITEYNTRLAQAAVVPEVDQEV